MKRQALVWCLAMTVALGACGEEEPTWQLALEHPRGDVRFLALLHLEKGGQVNLHVAGKIALDDPLRRNRFLAFRMWLTAMHQLDDHLILPVLTQLVETDPDSVIRRMALDAYRGLGKRGFDLAVAGLQRCLSGAMPWRRCYDYDIILQRNARAAAQAILDMEDDPRQSDAANREAFLELMMVLIALDEALIAREDIREWLAWYRDKCTNQRLGAWVAEVLGPADAP